MDPQAPNMSKISDSDDKVAIKSNHTDSVMIISIALFVLLSLGIIIFLYYQNQQLKSMLAKYKTEMSASPTPIATPDPTANWVSYPVPKNRGADLTGITYKIPQTALSPEWVNAGHYYQSVALLGNTFMGIFYIGAGQGYQYSYNQFVSQVITKFNLDKKPITVGGLTGQEFSGQIVSPIFGQDLLILGDGEGQFKGTIVKIDDNNSLYLLHYQATSTPAKSMDFQSDDATFDQILSTFKLVSPSPTPIVTPKIPVSTSSALPTGY